MLDLKKNDSNQIYLECLAPRFSWRPYSMHVIHATTAKRYRIFCWLWFVIWKEKIC